jgi:hypothetical protein
LAITLAGIFYANNSENLQGLLIKRYKNNFGNIKSGIEMGDEDPFKGNGQIYR